MKRLMVYTYIVLCATLFSGTASGQTVAAGEYDSIRVNGITLSYRIVGEGEPLVLLHGFHQTGETWERIFDEFAPRFRLIIPDLRGHGRSTSTGEQFTHRQAALDVYALLDLIGVDSFKAMGISTGGMTLLHMATSQPERIEALVLIGATSHFPEQAREIMRASDPDSVSAERMEKSARLHSRGMEQARELMSQFHAFKDSYDDMNFTPPYLSTITARTLIIHGDRDKYFPVSIPVEEYLTIPDSYLWIVPNGSHVPLLGSERGRRMFAESVPGFLAGDWD